MKRKKKKPILSNDFKNQKVVEKVEMIYKEIAEDDRRLAEDFLSKCVLWNYSSSGDSL